MTDILVIGGGISGLASAWALKRRGLAVRVLEAQRSPGGALASRVDEGFLIDEGANSALDARPAVRELVTALGLENELMEAAPAARNRYVVKEGRVLPLPLGPLDFLTSPLFSWRGKWRVMQEPFIQAAEISQAEETVAEFARRRLGEEMLDWAIDPFVSGVYAGDPERLSARAAVPKVTALEAAHGSLIKGAMKLMVEKKRQARASGFAGPSGRIVSFVEGMQTLARALAADLGEAVETGAIVRRLERLPRGGYRAHGFGGKQWQGQRLLLATPAYASAELLRPVDPALAAELDGIPYPTVTSVALGFRREQVQHPLDGFGVLIPRREGVPTLGALFSSSLFPNRAPEGQVLLTAFIGGRNGCFVCEQGPDAAVAQVLEDLTPLLGLSDEPTLARVRVWPRAIPQYELGHLERMARVEARLAEQPNLELRANWRDGISVGDCLQNALALAERWPG